MTGRLGTILDKVMSSGLSQRAASAGIGATLGALLGPTAATLTGDKKSDKDTLTRDMIAGAVGGAVGGLVTPAGGLLGGTSGGLVAGLLDRNKEASVGGQDLRLPVMGGTKFPTADSTGSAQKKLQQSSAEVGPQPSPTYSMMGKMKRAGDDMDPMMDDPLVQYLKGLEMETIRGLSAMGLPHGELDDNLSDMPLGKEEHELASKCPRPTPQMKSEGKSETKSAVGELFEHAHAARKKFDDKDHPFEGFDQGVVDRVLGR